LAFAVTDLVTVVASVATPTLADVAPDGTTTDVGGLDKAEPLVG